MGFWSSLGSWLGNNIIGIGQGVANVGLTNRQLAETELNNQFNRDLASKNYDETIKNNEFNRNLASANMEETLKNNSFNRDLASENMQETLRNNAFNRDMASKTFDFQKDQYENGVLNQAKQYEALGINPSAILGGLSSMPSMSNSQASSSGFSGASTGSFGGANTQGVSQAVLSGSNLSYNLGNISSLLAIEKQKAEIDNINADSSLKGAQTGESSARKDYFESQNEYQKILNEDAHMLYDYYHALGMSVGQIELFKNMDYLTASALGVSTIINSAIAWYKNGKDSKPVSIPPATIDAIEKYSQASDKTKSDLSQFIGTNWNSDNPIQYSADTIQKVDDINRNKKLSDEEKDIAINNILLSDVAHSIFSSNPNNRVMLTKIGGKAPSIK